MIKKYESACDAIIKAFEKKQGIRLDDWVDYYQIAGFSACYFFGLPEIIHDLRTNQPKGLILNWHDETVKNSYKNDRTINYNSYIVGLRYQTENKPKGK